MRQIHECGCYFLIIGSNQSFMNSVVVFFHNIKKRISEKMQCMDAPTVRPTNVMTNDQLPTGKINLLISCKNAFES